MTREQTLAILGRLAARYPGWQAGEETFADWGSKLAQFPAETVWRVIDRLTSLSESPWPPPLGQIRAAVRAELERQKPKALPEPVMPKEEFRTKMAELKAILDGGSGLKSMR